jgi:hypothetical protein
MELMRARRPLVDSLRPLCGHGSPLLTLKTNHDPYDLLQKTRSLPLSYFCTNGFVPSLFGRVANHHDPFPRSASGGDGRTRPSFPHQPRLHFAPTDS